MANALYGLGRASFGNAGIAWLTDTIKVALIDTGTYTVAIDTHDFWDDVVAGVIGTPATLASKTNALGVLDAADVTFTSVTGATVEALVIYKDTGVNSTSQLIAYIDSATNLPVTPNGGDITVAWDNTANLKIFKL